MNSPPSKYPKRKSRTKSLYHQLVVVQSACRALGYQDAKYHLSLMENSIRYLRGDDLKSDLRTV